jgi:RNA polymerase sigma-70 factor, ECF subfamily
MLPEKADPRSDEDLMSCLARGEMAALGVLYIRHNRLIQGVLHRCLGSLAPSHLQDLSQDVFLAIHDAAPKYQERGKLRSWLVSVALRTARSRRRQFWRRHAALTTTSKAMELSSRSPEAQVAARLEVDRAVAALPEVQREALFLHVAHDMTPDEIAAALGIKQNTVWTRLHRARRTMMQALGHAATKDSR